MTTNKEYLQSLEPRELNAWFESEHATPVDNLADCYDEETRTYSYPASKLTTCSNEKIAEFEAQINRLTRERDNLADDLLASNREREHLRKSLGIAIDRAHDICELVNLDEGLA